MNFEVNKSMKASFSKLAAVGLVLFSMTLGGLSQTTTDATWTLDESPKRKTVPVNPKPLFDIPKPLRKLFPALGRIEQEVNFGQAQGDAGILLKAVKDLGQAEFISGDPFASASSDRLLEEATEIAWQQRDPEALRESLGLWASPVRSGRNRDKILETTDRLEQVEKERAEMLKKKRCSIVFHNRTGSPVKVFVNRKPAGTLAAGEKHVVGEILAGRQYLGAEDESLQWGPRKVYVGPGEVFNWRLFD